jgi:hypothetical protein
MAKENKSISTAVPTGTIVAYAGKSIPIGWELCDGREVNPVTELKYKALFGAINTIWGGSGNPQFRLPDLRDKFIRGVNLTQEVGEKGGAETHAHGGTTSAITGGNVYGVRDGGANPPAATGTDHTHHVSTEEKNHLPPFIGVIYLIKL